VRKLSTYAVVAPFAIVLAFPFYWMLVTMFKTNLDQSNIQNNPYVYNPVRWEFWRSATTSHVAFVFNDTNYPTWLANTVIVGAVVVGITLLVALPAGYALARLSGGWGQSVGVGIFLVYLIPPTLLFLPLSRT
jgi:multiple sugar transport system permease protein